MTPELWEQLEALSETGKGSYDMRYALQKTKLDRCEKLCKLKYATCVGETGPGGSVLMYEITNAGREALTAHNAE